MVVLHYTKKIVIGSLFFSFGAVVACAQTTKLDTDTFVFDFVPSAIGSETIFDTSGNDLRNWNAIPFDGLKTGVLLFDLDGEGDLEEVTFNAGSFLNWTGTSGLGDDDTGNVNKQPLDAPGDYISISFNTDVLVDAVDLINFGTSQTLGSDSVEVEIGSSETFSFIAPASGNQIFDEAVFLAANEELVFNWVNGSFQVEGFTVSAVPEPSTVFLGGLGGLLAVLAFRKRRKTI